ncbi:MAG: NAD(P)H:quinone oxidoreductase [candidate division Zixibacteria bacterium]|nr:NAD(P)H:quinone oxidoreductase [candidate division Zixibacteria bacterium]
MKISIIFHSLHSHVYTMAEAVADGARSVSGADVGVFQVREILSEPALERMEAVKTKKLFAHIPIATTHNLKEADAIIFGTPTRFGNMTASMRAFLDETVALWRDGDLVGKVGSVFVSTGSQHGGHETTITSFFNTLIHHGMIIVGVPYTQQRLLNMDEITGGSAYGAGTIAAPDGSRRPSENELEIARFQGKRVAEITAKLVA